MPFATSISESLPEEEREEKAPLAKRYYHDVGERGHAPPRTDEGTALNGRKTTEIRPIWCERLICTRPHGSVQCSPVVKPCALATKQFTSPTRVRLTKYSTRVGSCFFNATSHPSTGEAMFSAAQAVLKSVTANPVPPCVKRVPDDFLRMPHCQRDILESNVFIVDASMLARDVNKFVRLSYRYKYVVLCRAMDCVWYSRDVVSYERALREVSYNIFIGVAFAAWRVERRNTMPRRRGVADRMS